MTKLSPSKVAKALGVHRTTVVRLCMNGTIRAFRLPGPGSHWRIEPDEISRLLASQGR